MISVMIPDFHLGGATLNPGMGAVSCPLVNIYYNAIYSRTFIAQFKLNTNSEHTVHSNNLTP